MTTNDTTNPTNDRDTVVENKCRCLIWHPLTPDERALVAERLSYARKVGDRHATMVNAVALAGPCPRH